MRRPYDHTRIVPHISPVSTSRPPIASNLCPARALSAASFALSSEIRLPPESILITSFIISPSKTPYKATPTALLNIT